MYGRLLLVMTLIGGLALSAAAQTTPPTLDQRILDAAEHFETITEQAYTKTKDELSSVLQQAETAVSGVAGDISPGGKAAVTSAADGLKSALATGTPSDIAIASVEAYRALVNEISTAHPVPKEVSLLDYAGFKIDALMKATAPDWSAIGQTLDFADQNWKAISGRVGDTALRDKFDASLVSLRASVAARDSAKIQNDAATELALVDDLEKYFLSR